MTHVHEGTNIRQWENYCIGLLPGRSGSGLQKGGISLQNSKRGSGPTLPPSQSVHGIISRSQEKKNGDVLSTKPGTLQARGGWPAFLSAVAYHRTQRKMKFESVTV